MRAFEFLQEAEPKLTRALRDEEVKITVPAMDDDQIDIADTGADPGKVNTTIAQPATTEYPEEPIWIFPGQQVLELQKQAGGKSSPVINQIIKSDNGPDSDPDDGVFADLADDGTAESDDRSIYNDCALKSGK